MSKGELPLAGKSDLFMDVNQQRQGDSAVREKAARYGDAKAAGEPSRCLSSDVQSLDDAIIGKNFDGTITNWNGGAERMSWLLGCPFRVHARGVEAADSRA